MKSIAIACTALLLLSSACDNNPGEGKPEAKTAAPIEAKAQEQKPADSSSVPFVISAENSKLEFVGAKITAKHEGKFTDFKGTIDVVGGDPKKSRVSLVVEMASLEIDPPKLAGHLKGSDFFDVEKFSTAQFESTSLKETDKAAVYDVTGNLTLHGQKKSISFPATIKLQPNEVAVDAEFSIQRKDFGIVYPGMPDDLIKESVLIRLKLNPKKS